MPFLSDETELYVGGTRAQRIYLGANTLWTTSGPGAGSSLPLLRGVNSATAEFGTRTTETNGVYDADASLAHYISRGMNVVRIPFLWERMQPTLNGALNAVEISRLQTTVSSVTSRGAVAILDVHNYCRYTTAANANLILGDGTLVTANFTDLWRRLATLYKDQPLVQFGLMNEPHDLGGAGGLSQAKQWENTSQACVTTIRATGATNYIWVPPVGWGSAGSCWNLHPQWWINDPLKRTGIEGHYYFDAGNSGSYDQNFAAATTHANNTGYPNVEAMARDNITRFVKGARDRGVRALLGEIGWNGTSEVAQWNAVGDAVYQIADDYGMSVTYWAAGDRWGGYKLLVYKQGVSYPPATVVEAHKGPAPGSFTPTAPPVTGTASMALAVSVEGGPGDVAAVNKFQADGGGAPVTHVMFYQSWDVAFNRLGIDLVSDSGRIPVFTWEPWAFEGTTAPNWKLSKIANGDHDARLDAAGTALAALNKPVVLRFAHEMNGDWYPWSEKNNGNAVGDYVRAYRRMVDRIRAKNANKVTFAWSPNISYTGSTPLAGLYPGDAYVDVVAVDGYNFGTSQPGKTWDSPQTIFDATFTEIRQFTNKPLWIGETGCAEQGGNKAAWIASLFAYLKTKNVSLLTWFDYNKEADWRITSTPAATTAWRNGVQALGGTTPVDPLPPVTPPASNIYDTFDTADATRWDGYGEGVIVEGGSLVIPVTPDYRKLRSRKRWDLISGDITVEVTRLPAQGNGTTIAALELNPTDSDRAIFGLTGGASYVLERYVEGARQEDLYAASDPTHKLWRVRRDGADVRFETSTDGNAWTRRFTVPAAQMITTNLRLDLSAGYYGTETAPGSARFGYVAVTAPMSNVAPPSTSSRMLAGFSISEIVGMSAADATAIAGRAKAAGADTLRFDIAWPSVAPTENTRDWATFDRVFAAARTHGLKMLPILDYTPAWARPAGTSNSNPPTSTAQWSNYVTEVVTRYDAPDVVAWEIWNEQNAGFWSPAPDVVRYTQLLKAAYTAIRATGSTKPVLTGGTAPAVNGPNSVEPSTFLRGIYDNGGKGYFDGVSAHPYCFPALPGEGQSWSGWTQMVAQRAVMVEKGDSALGVWATEAGAPTIGPGEASTLADRRYASNPRYVDQGLQAATVTEAFNQAKNMPWLKSMLWYALEDLPVGSSGQGDGIGGYGLTTNAPFTRRQAYNAWTTAVAELNTSTPPPTTGGGDDDATADDTFAGDGALDANKWTSAVTAGASVSRVTGRARLRTGNTGGGADKVTMNYTAAPASTKHTLSGIIVPDGKGQANEAYFRVNVRSPLLADTDSGDRYSLLLQSWDGAWAFVKSVGGTATFLSSAQNTWTDIAGWAADVPVRYEIISDGAALQVRVWTGATRPASPQWSTTTETSISAPGYTGVALSGGTPARVVTWYLDSWRATTSTTTTPPVTPPTSADPVYTGTLYDTFTTANSARWTGFSETAPRVYVNNGAAVITCATTYPKLTSTQTWDLTTGTITVGVGALAAAGNGTTSTGIELAAGSPDNRFVFGVSAGKFFLETYVNGQRRPDQYGDDYPTGTSVWRARRAGAALVFETSTNGTAFTTQFTIADPPITMTALTLYLACGFYGTETAPGAAQFTVVSATAPQGADAPPVTPPVVTPPVTTGAGTAWRPFVHQPGGIGSAVSLKWGNAAGARCKLNGVNVWGLPVYDGTHANHAQYMYANRVAAMDKIDAMGANLIRLRVDAIVNAYNQSAWNVSQNEVLNRVEAWVNLAKARGMVTMICNWDSYNMAGNWGNRYTESFGLFSALLDRLGKDNPYVIYEFANEPNNLEQFQQGWFTAVRGTIAHFRDTKGYTGPLVVDPTGWAHNYSDDVFTQIEQHDASRAVMGGKHQLIWARHDYGNEFPGNNWSRDKWFNETGGNQNDHLIFETEYGKYNIDTLSSDGWTRGASAYFAGQGYNERANHVGGVAFLAGPWRDNGTIGNGMTTDGSVTNLTPWGDVVDQVLLTGAAVEGTPAVGQNKA